MKNFKLGLIILISFSLGIGISQGFFGKNTIKAEKAEEHGEHEEEHGEGEGTLKVSEKSQSLIGLKTVKAQLTTFKKKVSVIGQIAQDAETSVHVVSPVTGEIVETKAEIGSFVNKGDVLGAVAKINGEVEIHKVTAPITGVIIGAFAKVKDRVDTVSSLYTIADLTKLLATFDVYEKDIAEIKLGQKVIIQAVAYPGKIFEGEITFISPRVDEEAHTIKVRALIRNPDNYLKLGMFINADIIIESDVKSVVLPQESVQTISAKRIVFIMQATDKFEPREVNVRDENRDEVALADGVREGEDVVVQDVFLLKSELLKSKMGEGCAE